MPIINSLLKYVRVSARLAAATNVVPSRFEGAVLAFNQDRFSLHDVLRTWWAARLGSSWRAC